MFDLTGASQSNKSPHPHREGQVDLRYASLFVPASVKVEAGDLSATFRGFLWHSLACSPIQEAHFPRAKC